MFRLNNKVIFYLLFCATLALAIWIATHGSWQFFSYSFLGEAYDSFSEHLLKGSFEVNPKAIAHEGFHYNDKTYMYFGIFPVFIRFFLYIFFSAQKGKLTFISILLAYTGCLYLFKKIIDLSKKEWDFSCYLYFVAFAFSGPPIFLLERHNIYEECIAWAFCFSLFALYSFLSFSKNEDLKYLLIFSSTCGLALLAKFTFALPYIIFSILFVLKRLIIKDKRLVKTLLCFLPLAFCLALQGYLNQQRFGSALSFDCKITQDCYKGGKQFGKKNIENHIKNWQKFEITEPKFSLTRLYSGFGNYFLINSKYLLTEPPFLKLIDLEQEDSVYKVKKHMLPLTLSCSWLVLAALIGFIHFIRKNTKPDSLFLALSLALQPCLIFIYRATTYRYSTECLPLLIMFFFYFLQLINQSKNLKSRWFFITQLILMISSIYANLVGMSLTAEFWHYQL